MFSTLNNHDLVCFSHLRWDFIFQRPQHLLTRFQNHQRVFFIEEPVFSQAPQRTYTSAVREENIYLIVPQLREGSTSTEIENGIRNVVEQVFADYDVHSYIFWYYTPMALKFSREFEPAAVVYDCMDELSAFKFADPTLPLLEKEMFERADVVFTGGHSLYEAKKDAHPNIHPVPSSIDIHHFHKARAKREDPADQAQIPHPRLGYYGAIDERVNYELIDAVAAAHPEWSIVMIGPVVKVDPAHLPRRSNIYYLGGKPYSELPHYLAGWDVALLPFALNESTKFISPTKTPEYLAGGKPSVSTPIRDVVRPYGEKNLVRIAATPTEFVSACEAAMTEKGVVRNIEQVDAFLSSNSWDNTWSFMARHICKVLEDRELESDYSVSQSGYAGVHPASVFNKIT